jgi:Putative phage tail protein
MAGILGGPLGGFISLGVGILLQFLFPQKVEGPRQENTKTSTNKYGDVIGHTHGTVRIAGAYIWLQGDKIKERKRTYRAGKGGPEVTEYSYFSTTMSVFDWTGPVAAISRVWIDKQLAYDNTTEALSTVINGGTGTGFGEWDGVTFTFYLGTLDQEPNALMVADKGADSVPGYRGMVALVMQELNHENIGIRLPNIEVEIVHDAAYDYLSVLLINDEYPSGFDDSVAIDWVSKVAVFYDRAISGATVNKAWAYSLTSGALLWSKFIVYASGLTGIDGDPYVDFKGVVWFSDRIGQADAYDIFTGARLPAYDRDHTSASINSENFNRMTYDSTGNTYGALFRGTTVNFIETTSPGSHTFTLRASVSAGIDAGTSTRGACVRYDEDNDALTFYIITNYVVYKVDELSSTNINLNSLYSSGINGTVVYVPQDDTILVRASNGIWKLDALTLALVTSTSSYGGSAVHNHAEQRGVDDDGVFWFSRSPSVGVSYMVKFDAVNFALIEEFGPVSYTGDNSNLYPAYIPEVNGFLSLRGNPTDTWNIDYLPTITRGSIPLADVLEAECALVGLTVDVSEVSKNMRGYAVKDESTPRGVIEDLCRVYGIDHVQVDGVYKFFERDNVVDVTISSDHVGADLKDSGFPQKRVKETLADVMDLPNSFTFGYLAYDAQYRVGSQRIDMPLDSTESANEQTAKTNAALTDNEGAQAADVLLRESREIPDVYEFSLPPYYSRLHPGDVVTLPLEGNKTIRVVINEIEDDLVMKVKAHKRTIDYSSDAIGVATPNTDGTLISDAVGYFIPLDLNMMRDLDAEDNSGYYFCAYYRGTTEPSSINVFRSSDAGVTYDGWATLTGYPTVGVLLTALPSVSSPYVPYREASFDFTLYSGDAPASVTEDQFIDGTLLCAVETTAGEGGEWEIISVKTITDLGPGTYRATGLVRGYRGTENMCDDHEVGNRVVWLDPEVIARVLTDTIGTEYYFVPVPSGKIFDSANSITFTNTGAALKPYRPVSIVGVRDVSNNLDVTWIRQSRFSYQLQDGTETVPLNETSEEYEVEYYEGSTLLRTRTGLTAQSDSYLLTEYQTDSGNGSATVIPTLRVVVYQISQELTVNSGRGYPGEANL